MNTKWTPPQDWISIKTVEAHAAGEPLRVIVEGLPPLPGNTILEKDDTSKTIGIPCVPP